MIAMWLVWVHPTLYAQSLYLTTAAHTPMASDSLVVYQIPYRATTDNGDNCAWDFSRPAQPPVERYADYYRPYPMTPHILPSTSMVPTGTTTSRQIRFS